MQEAQKRGFNSVGEKPKSDNHRSIPDRDYRGFPAGCSGHGTRRYVFERLNVSTEHVFENAFHGAPDSN